MNTKRTIIFTVVIFISAVVLIAYSFVEPYWLKITNIEILNSKIPNDFNGTKVVYIADIHCGPYFSTKRVQHVVDMINNIQPDIILLGGDYVHRSSEYIKPVFLILKGLKAKLFVGGVMGNHDHWESKKLTIEFMKKANIFQLDNASLWIRKNKGRIKIGGVGDLWEDWQFLSNTTKDLSENDYCILLSHNPDYFEKLHESKVNLVLSGHTHGGQVTFFGLCAPILPVQYRKYWKGIFYKDKTVLYVTTGIGTITPPVRFFSRPEILCIILKNN